MGQIWISKIKQTLTSLQVLRWGSEVSEGVFPSQGQEQLQIS